MSAQDRNVTRHVSQLLGAGAVVKGRSRRLPVRESAALEAGVRRQHAEASVRPIREPQAGAAATSWRGGRPFDGSPGVSRLFGGRRRAACPRC
jgi:hypothetical protein